MTLHWPQIIMALLFFGAWIVSIFKDDASLSDFVGTTISIILQSLLLWWGGWWH